MADDPVLKPPTATEIRAELEDLVVNDLYGPIGGADEEFGGERPTDRYILGRLAPNGAVFHPEEQDNLAETSSTDASVVATEAESGDDEPEAPGVPSMFCSGYGFTACVALDTTKLLARASWARYHQTAPTRKGGAHERVWQRQPTGGSARVPLSDGVFGPIPLDPEQPQVCVRGRVRTYNGVRLVTVFLVNGQRGEYRESGKWLFQAELELTADDGATAVFVPRPENIAGGDARDRDEQRRLAMNYRFCAEFATGHSVATDVTTLPEDPMRATTVRTAAVPRHEVPHTDVPTAQRDPDLAELAGLVVDMSELAALEPREVHDALDPLITGYRAWIARQRARVDDPAEHLGDFHREARENLREAERAAGRIENAITLLAEDPEALRCFRFANEAMRSQRVQTLAAAQRRKDREAGGDPAIHDVAARLDDPKNYSWRPFQLAFLLLNLPSLTDPAHEERTGDQGRVADLLWFPTGGGKTEAYLGLTAYTLAIRRRQGTVGGLHGHSGVAVLMRYTLRLLTIQQFQRATALLCACETLRRDNEDTWGRVPFRTRCPSSPPRTWERRRRQRRICGASSWCRGCARSARFTGSPASTPPSSTSSAPRPPRWRRSRPSRRHGCPAPNSGRRGSSCGSTRPR